MIVPPHPLISHHLAIARNKDTPNGAFKAAVVELGKLLIYELSRDWLPIVEMQVETPCGVADIKLIDPREPVAVVPILRAGLVPIEKAQEVTPP